MNEAGHENPARAVSARTVLATLLARGPLSRADVARLTGFSKQTISEVARQLEEAGWIRPNGRSQGPLGRSATVYEIDASRAYVLGVDLGGTKVHVALADMLGHVVGEGQGATEPRGGRAVVDQIAGLAAEAAARAGIPADRIGRAAIGSAGVLERASGRILFAPNIPGLDQFDVVGALAAALGCPVTIENDVNLAALGERRQPGRGAVDDLAFIALGTGIGMGIVAGGRLVRGARGGAGEIAYLPLGGDPFDPRGARLGTLETAIGSAAIKARYEALGGEAGLDVRGMFERFTAGDGAAATTIDEVARVLVQAIMAIRAVLDPGLIVLGGGIGSRSELVERVRDLAARHIGSHPPIEASVLGGRAVLAGALGQALDELRADPFAVTCV